MWHGGSIQRDLGCGTYTIGRGADLDLPLDHPSISRRHANLIVADSLRLEDLGSMNGCWVAGARVGQGATVEVSPGAMIELGSALMVIRRGAEHVAGSSASPSTAGGIVVADAAMVELHRTIDVVARSQLSVVLLGETGVGKEVVASRVHERSRRADRPFLKVNCAALAESLLEGELFGHERGAFTGATHAKVGLLEAADGGTLFLDEVGELSLTTQAKLLRVLESGEIMRVGAVKPRTVDVRFVAATNRDLRESVAAGVFREDLFFRLDGCSVWVPPLRSRTAEILPLAETFARDACQRAGRPLVSLSLRATQALLRHSWPGNVRELKNVVARSIVLCPRDVLEAEDLRFDGAALGRASTPTRNPALEARRARTVDALERSGGNQTRAAKLLGVSRRTLVNWLTELSLPRPRK